MEGELRKSSCRSFGIKKIKSAGINAKIAPKLLKFALTLPIKLVVKHISARLTH
jgi:hypothetical protein